VGQTVHHKLINHFQRADLRKRHAEKPNSLLHARSIRRRLNSYNFAAGLDYNFLQPQSIRSWLRFVEQKNHALFEQKNTIPKGLNSYNFDAGLDYENTTGSKRLQAAE
jgi:hypothetical protein